MLRMKEKRERWREMKGESVEEERLKIEREVRKKRKRREHVDRGGKLGGRRKTEQKQK